MSTTHKPPVSRRNIAFLERRRRKAALLFRKGTKHADIARRLKTTRTAVHKWYRIWKKSGIRGLRSAGRLGRKPKLTPDTRKRIRTVLLRGPREAGYTTEFWTLERITEVIQRTTGVVYHPGHVWKILGVLGWSCQKPETRAKERDEKAIRRWQERTWPRMQKKG